MANSRVLPDISESDLSRFQGYSSKRERFGFKTDCWIWTGGKFRQGYGLFVLNGLNTKAHRVAWKIHTGRDPDGQIDHLCHDPRTCEGGFGCPHRACVNPDHLACVSQKENVLRGGGPTAINAQKTHCVRGHEFTPENTVLDSGGWRQCRQCHRDKASRYRQENREEILARRSRNRARVVYAPRPCPRCGKEYTPIRSTSTQCPDCRKRPTEYQREYMRAYRVRKRDGS